MTEFISVKEEVPWVDTWEEPVEDGVINESQHTVSQDEYMAEVVEMERDLVRSRFEAWTVGSSMGEESSSSGSASTSEVARRRMPPSTKRARSGDDMVAETRAKCPRVLPPPPAPPPQYWPQYWHHQSREFVPPPPPPPAPAVASVRRTTTPMQPSTPPPGVVALLPPPPPPKRLQATTKAKPVNRVVLPWEFAPSIPKSAPKYVQSRMIATILAHRGARAEDFHWRGDSIVLPKWVMDLGN
jgi:hypothetical protein